MIQFRELFSNLIVMLKYHEIQNLGVTPALSVGYLTMQLIPNVVLYENWTAIDGEVIEFKEAAKVFLEQRGHLLQSVSGGAVCQLVVHDLQDSLLKEIEGKKVEINDDRVFHGMLTAVSDPRKDGRPAGL